MLVPAVNDVRANDDQSDVATVPCNEFSDFDGSTKSMMVMWIDGYVGGSTDNTEFGHEWYARLFQHMIDYCKSQPSATMMSSINALPKPKLNGQRDFDFLQYTCETFNLEESSRMMTIFWVDGFLSAQNDNTMIDDTWIEELSSHIVTFCQNNPDGNLSDALNALN